MDKNYIHPNLETVVPKELRFLIYQEALDYYLNEDYLIYKFDISNDKQALGLCLLLPCLLWNLNSYVSNTPSNEDWDYDLTQIAFPEITPFIPKILGTRGYNNINKNRIQALNEILSLKD